MNQNDLQDMLNAMDDDQNGGRPKFWTPEEGENVIRFLPPMKKNDEKLPYFHHKVHWLDGKPYECLSQTFTDKNGNVHEAEPCPACQLAKKLYKTAEKGSEEHELAYSISAKDRYVFRIIDRSKKLEEQVNPEFYEVGPSIYKKFFNILKSQKYGNIVHPMEGRDFIIDRQGTGRRTNYDNSLPAPDKSPIFEDKEMLKKAFENATAMSYNDLIEFPTFNEINQATKEAIDPEAALADDGDTISRRTDDEAPQKNSVKETPLPRNEEVEEDDTSNDEIDDILGEFTS
ncbi:MAG: hypothetical protein ACOC1O_00985 [bacterium]